MSAGGKLTYRKISAADEAAFFVGVTWRPENRTFCVGGAPTRPQAGSDGFAVGRASLAGAPPRTKPGFSVRGCQMSEIRFQMSENFFRTLFALKSVAQRPLEILFSDFSFLSSVLTSFRKYAIL